VWNIGQPTPNLTLYGHEKGVNCVDYYSGDDRLHLLSGADENLAKVWDYHKKAYVQVSPAGNMVLTAFRFQFAKGYVLFPLRLDQFHGSKNVVWVHFAQIGRCARISKHERLHLHLHPL
jgi:WD40 repeat protein